jgi:glucose/arabinose dehydrogenase
MRLNFGNMTIQLQWVLAGLMLALGSVGAQRAVPLPNTQPLQAAQSLPPCAERPGFRDPPWIDGRRYCLENVILDPTGGELAFTALATASDGTLYAARPLRGEVLSICDSNGDALPDQARVIASDLTLPNGLAWHDSALYITAGSRLYRLVGDQLDVLVDDLPMGSSGWAGSVIVGPDDRLYVSTSASCDFCVPQQPDLGAILSYALDGSDRQIVASGLRRAGDIAFLHGDLWATDSARTGLADVPDLDELNAVRWGENFGWPYCVGMDNQPDELAGDFDCITAAAPALTFPTGSTPTGMVAYTSDTLPDLNGSLIVVLHGSYNQPDLRGYALVAVRFDEQATPLGYDVLIPFEVVPPNRTGYSLSDMNYRGSGFWPHRPLDVAVSPEGWLYLSVGGGQIMVIRPA